ncbi:MAG: AAA family ATPase [Acidobacteriota bacterium]|nr:MAG: AAA family ATPase [Acidobacteriota bacterium]
MAETSAKPSSTTLHEFTALIDSLHPVIVVETVEEERVVALLERVAAKLRLPLFEWSVTTGLTAGSEGPPAYGTANPLILLKHLGGLSIEGLFLLKDFHSYLEDAEVRRQFRELGERFSDRRSTIILSGDGIELSNELEAHAIHYELKLPGRGELQEMVRDTLQSLRSQATPFRIELSPEELDDLLSALRGLTLKQARQAVAYCISQDRRLSREDIATVLQRKGQALSESGLLEYYPAVSNAYELGGFSNLRRWLERVRVGFSKRAQSLNLKPPKGILLVGVQGCGKSLAAKYVARTWKLPLLKLDASALYDKYIGESEKNLRKAIQQAESMEPVVLWIDEIEKALASSSTSDADGGLSRRILGAFLTWLQEKKDGVFVVATANDIQALPPELLRKGRFDEIFFVDLPDFEERIEILSIHLHLRGQNPALIDSERLAQETDGFSGAEIEQVVISALYRALHEERSLSTELLCSEVRATKPLSVTRSEEVSNLRRWAIDRFVSVR